MYDDDWVDSRCRMFNMTLYELREHFSYDPEFNSRELAAIDRRIQQKNADAFAKKEEERQKRAERELREAQRKEEERANREYERNRREYQAAADLAARLDKQNQERLAEERFRRNLEEWTQTDRTPVLRGKILDYFHILQDVHYPWTPMDIFTFENLIKQFLKLAIKQAGPFSSDRFTMNSFYADRRNYFLEIGKKFHTITILEYRKNCMYFAHKSDIDYFMQRIKEVHEEILVNSGFVIKETVMLCLGMGLGKIAAGAGKIAIKGVGRALGWVVNKSYVVAKTAVWVNTRISSRVILTGSKLAARGSKYVAERGTKYIAEHPRVAKAFEGAKTLINGKDISSSSRLIGSGVNEEKLVRASGKSMGVAVQEVAPQAELVVQIPGAKELSLDYFLKKVENFTWDGIKKNNGWTAKEINLWEPIVGETGDDIIGILPGLGTGQTIVNIVAAMWQKNQLENELGDLFTQHQNKMFKAEERGHDLRKDAEKLSWNHREIEGLILVAGLEDLISETSYFANLTLE